MTYVCGDSVEFARQVRKLSIEMVHKAQASHIASALSICDLLAVMMTREDIFYFPSARNEVRDRLLLSKGHACTALYSSLFLKGCFGRELLESYGTDMSPLMNHASHHVPGVEFSTGALGHALPVACGKALAAKLSNTNWHNYAILSDGEMQEGSNWEAILFASHWKLDNLTAFIDFNNLQSLGSVDDTLSIRPLEEKFSSFGWDAFTIDGHDHCQIYDTILEAKSSSLPTAIILNTLKGKGVSFMEGSVKWHYSAPNSNQAESAYAELEKS